MSNYNSYWKIHNIPILGRVLFLINLKQDSISAIIPETHQDFDSYQQQYLSLQDAPLVDYAAHQIIEYINGERMTFDSIFNPCGGHFQLSVWSTLTKTNYGTTYSYKDIASMMYIPDSYRAVASAIAANPLLIVIPCHRVIPKNQTIGNYSAGKILKEKLLGIESRYKKY